MMTHTCRERTESGWNGSVTEYRFELQDPNQKCGHQNRLGDMLIGESFTSAEWCTLLRLIDIMKCYMKPFSSNRKQGHHVEESS